MRRAILAFAAVLLGSTAVYAADIAMMAPSAPIPAAAPSSSAFATRFGIGFDAQYVDQVQNDEGTYANGFEDGWLYGGLADFSIASNNASGFGFQADLSGALFGAPPNTSNDWTRSWITAGLHIFTRNQGTSLWGVFGGGGIHDDTGDTSETMSHWFGGAEGQLYRPNAVLFGQVGYIGSHDEYQEGLNDGGFLRLGGSYFLSNTTVLKGAISGAFGRQDPSDSNGKARLADLQLEMEHSYGTSGLSAFAGYEGTFISVARQNDGNVEADFHALTIGLRFRTGASDLKSAYSSGASLDLPPVNRWVAYTANEIE